MLEDNIKKLIRILEESKVDELEVSTFWGKQKIKISKKSNHIIDRNIEINNPTQIEKLSKKNINESESQVEPNTKKENIENNNLVDSDNISIKSPLVGTFYKSSKPGDPPFINIGDQINKGDTICIIEAMKIFNEIEAEVTGKIIEILVEDGTPVEYDQPLVIVTPI
tara:strand:- start:1317 stop:1817 length:501 start_codon:yes stop_codon:yes gene_type:complete